MKIFRKAALGAMLVVALGLGVYSVNWTSNAVVTEIAKTCSGCKGTGSSSLKCSHCKGTGKNGTLKCSLCRGTGWQKCSGCNGSGETK